MIGRRRPRQWRAGRPSTSRSFSPRRALDWVRDRRWPSLALTVLLYAAAFVPLVLLYQSRPPLLAGAVGAGLVGLVFSLTLLALASAPPRRAATYGLGIGLVLAELAWAISFWSVAGLVGGALLWLALYTLTGLSQAHLEGVLDRRVAIEYLVVSVIGLGIILSSEPWRV